MNCLDVLELDAVSFTRFLAKESYFQTVYSRIKPINAFLIQHTGVTLLLTEINLFMGKKAQITYKNFMYLLKQFCSVQ